MQWSLAAAAAAAIFVQLATANAADNGADLPLRKAGLWEVQTKTDEGRGVRSHTLTLCIGEEMERNTVHTSQLQNKANCSKYELRRTGEGTTIDSQCAYDGREVTSHMELRGDFNTRFEVKVESLSKGNAPRAQGGMPVNVKRTILQEGRFLGETCGELHAGEAKNEQGRTVIVQ